MEIEDQLRDALHRSMRGVDPPVRDLVASAVREGRSPRRSPRGRRVATRVAGGVVAAAVVAAAVAVSAPWADPPTGSPAAGTGRCHAAREAVLPSWARAGFTDPEPLIAHVLGDHARIVAILFGRVLHAPPAREVNNKILWVPRPTRLEPREPTSGLEPLRIEAVRYGDDRLVRREVAGGPGPSTVDLPTAGCWHLTLQWGERPDQRDTMDLQYVAPREPAPHR